VIISVVRKDVINCSDTTSSKVCNLLWRKMFLVVPTDDPGTHFVGYLRCHDGWQNRPNAEQIWLEV